MVTYYIQYSKRESRGRNIPGGEQLLKNKYLLSESLSPLFKINGHGHTHPNDISIIIMMNSAINSYIGTDKFVRIYGGKPLPYANASRSSIRSMKHCELKEANCAVG